MSIQITRYHCRVVSVENDHQRKTVIIDENVYGMLSKSVAYWKFNKDGYVYNPKETNSYLHEQIWNLSRNKQLFSSQSIEHINGINTDNRAANLRIKANGPIEESLVRQDLIDDAIVIMKIANRIDPSLYPPPDPEEKTIEQPIEQKQEPISPKEEQNIHVRDGGIIYDMVDHNVMQCFSWKPVQDGFPKIKIPKKEAAVNIALSSRYDVTKVGLNAIPEDLKESRVNVGTFVARVLYGMEVPEGYCVVPINHEQLDIRKNNLAIVCGDIKNFKGASLCWPKALEGKIKYASNVLSMLSRGLMLSEMEGVYTLYYKKPQVNGKKPRNPHKASFGLHSIEEIEEFVKEYMDLINDDWPNNSPFKDWKALDPNVDKALRLDWQTANDYYTNMVESYYTLKK
jgi:hypothetical protein